MRQSCTGLQSIILVYLINRAMECKKQTSTKRVHVMCIYCYLENLTVFLSYRFYCSALLFSYLCVVRAHSLQPGWRLLEWKRNQE